MAMTLVDVDYYFRCMRIGGIVILLCFCRCLKLYVHARAMHLCVHFSNIHVLIVQIRILIQYHQFRVDYVTHVNARMASRLVPN
jgi:hypothetical protein